MAVHARQRVAVRRGSTLSLLFGDHLGSTSYTADPVLGRRWTSLRYKAWGETRYASGTTQTGFRLGEVIIPPSPLKLSGTKAVGRVE
jgi:hypothetical protein